VEAPEASEPSREPPIQQEPPTEDRVWIKRALVADIVIVPITWTLLVLGRNGLNIIPVGDVTVLGVAFMLIPLVTFGGFYLSSPATATSRDPWMRNALAVTFVMNYLFFLALLLLVPHIRESLAGFGEQLFTGFTTFVGTVLAFYFATQAAERITETVQSGMTTRAAIERHSELAQQVVNEQQSASRKGGPPF
jgi:hypothetical protein